ncbi:MAG: cell envelope integrity protein CreD [Leptospiraceae bacterium]|nr:cell envelope integrity protein CreD [Leptospiraceae bacterium]
MQRLSLKLLIIGLLIMALLIPTFLIYLLIYERQARQSDVFEESARVWGQPQILAGPVWLHDDQNQYAENMTIEGQLNVETRRRGIYRVPFYTAEVTITGQMRMSGNGQLVLHSSDSSRIRIKDFQIDGRSINAERRSDGTIAVDVPRNLTYGNHEFAVRLECPGIQSFHALPAAENTTIELTSNWPDPSFVGDMLPTARTINADGFNARWQINGNQYFDLPTMYVRADEFDPAEVSGAGVSFFVPVDIYQQNTRALKYAILFIILTFLTYFIFEALYNIRSHPLHYLLVGAALCVFFLLLLSFSEHVGFLPAYAIAMLASIALIAYYSRHVLGNIRHTAIMTAMLAGLYAFLYVLLQLEVYALLAGSVGLFLILAAVMFATRRIDWYNLKASAQESSHRQVE